MPNVGNKKSRILKTKNWGKRKSRRKIIRKWTVRKLMEVRPIWINNQLMLIPIMRVSKIMRRGSERRTMTSIMVSSLPLQETRMTSQCMMTHPSKLQQKDRVIIDKVQACTMKAICPKHSRVTSTGKAIKKSRREDMKVRMKQARSKKEQNQMKKQVRMLMAAIKQWQT